MEMLSDLFPEQTLTTWHCGPIFLTSYSTADIYPRPTLLIDRRQGPYSDKFDSLRAIPRFH